jgi:IS5 family transposase
MKAHVGVDMATGSVHTVVGTAGNVADVTQAHALLHGGETAVLGDASYQGVGKRPRMWTRRSTGTRRCGRACAAMNAARPNAVARWTA